MKLTEHDTMYSKLNTEKKENIFLNYILDDFYKCELVDYVT